MTRHYSTADTAAGYRHFRALWPERPASYALACVRERQATAAMIDRLSTWRFEGSRAIAYVDDLPADALRVQVSVDFDSDPVDWGDLDPTQEERDAAGSVFVAVVVEDDGTEVYTDAIGGVDFIDLPGYTCRDWEDAAAYALRDYLLDEAEAVARREPGERAAWAARGVVTV